MILCHCNVVSDRDVRAAISAVRAGGREAQVTPGRVHKHLGVSPRCGKCTRHVAGLIREGADCNRRRLRTEG